MMEQLKLYLLFIIWLSIKSKHVYDVYDKMKL